MRRFVFAATTALIVATFVWRAWPRLHEQAVETDVLVAGAGIAGLSAAYEAGQGGLRVAVADMNSVFGGNAVLSEGGLFIAASPRQAELGLQDSPELAERDMLAWGEDADPAWVHSFVYNSRREIYDWMTALGVRFTAIRPQAGNHVPRFHENRERGLGITRPIYRECLKLPNIRFFWNTRIESLTKTGTAVSGARGVNLRNGGRIRFHARAVVLATGGFQGNERLVRQHWNPALPQPERILLGASPHSAGIGLRLGVEAGAATHRLDHQWHYPFGVPDPRLPGEKRAVSVRNLNALWINAHGERFVNEWESSRYSVDEVARQRPATYWLVFDSPGIDDLRYSGADWADLQRARALLVDNPAITKRGQSWDELARHAGLPAARLRWTVERYNRLVAAGEDLDFHRFGKQALPPWLLVFPPPLPRALTQPPFYAMQAFRMTRKSMGGLRIDLDARVTDASGQPIPGLFAAGEVAGLGGVNGKAGLEGTFLGPSVMQGRRAGRFLVASLKTQAAPALAIDAPPAPAPTSANSLACRVCHTLPMRLFASRSGYRHFGRAHRMAEERGLDCRACHAEVELLRPWRHRISGLAQLSNCDHCHLAPVAATVHQGSAAGTR